jgi:hypothetical protein
MARKKNTPRQRQPAQQNSYPAPDVRQQIIGQRDQIMQELLYIFSAVPAQRHLVEVRKLGARYGLREVLLVLDAFLESTGRELITEEAWLYRHYRQAFARYGVTRPFLNRQAYEALVYEHGLLVARRMLTAGAETGPSTRERELRDLLLLDSRYWRDIVPPAAPPRPADFEALSPGTYQPPERALLSWGWDLDAAQIDQEAKKRGTWLPVIPKLLEMALDEGLLGGWPGEKASWAPYYALHLLGRLHAHSYAAALLALLDRPDDWLADQLPPVWAQMGPPAEQALWPYLSDNTRPSRHRAVAARGLRAIAEAHPARRPDIVAGLTQWLDQSTVEDATVNSYVIVVLKDMAAIEAADAVQRAYEQNKVNQKIITPSDVTWEAT